MSMSYPNRRIPTVTQTSADDRSRLALLWRAFEEAEERIRELERESDERPGRALQPRPTSEEGAATRAALARIEQEAGRRHEALLASIAKLDAEIAKGSAENDALRQKLAAAHARHADIERELGLQRSRVDVANLILEEERETVRAMEGAADRQAVDHATRETMLKDALAHASSEIERLAHRHEEAATACAQAEARRDAAEREIARRRDLPLSPPSRPHRLFPVEATRTGQLPTITSDEIGMLRAAGVNMADALLYADLTTLGKLSGIGVARLWKLRALAEIMTLHGIGPDWALRLFHAGVRSIEDVARMGGEELHAKIWSTYANERLLDEARVMLERTLPGRCVSVAAAAREAMAR